MNDLSFDIELRWTGTDRDRIGEIRTEGLVFDLSTPDSVGGRGVGTSPEELLVSAVSACYSATLFAVLRGAQLPVDSLSVGVRGVVAGFPGNSRFDRLTISPTILGGDPARQPEYETSALLAYDRCLLGNAITPEVTSEISAVQVRSEPTPASNGGGGRAGDPCESLVRDDTTARVLAWRSGE